jgi:hypothetical protein
LFRVSSQNSLAAVGIAALDGIIADGVTAVAGIYALAGSLLLVTSLRLLAPVCHKDLPAVAGVRELGVFFDTDVDPDVAWLLLL